jgi:hypothetical protein
VFTTTLQPLICKDTYITMHCVSTLLMYTHFYQLEFMRAFARGKLNETRRDRDCFSRLIEYAYEKINMVPKDTMTLMVTKANWTLQQYIQLTDILFIDNNLNVSTNVCTVHMHCCSVCYDKLAILLLYADYYSYHTAHHALLVHCLHFGQ